MKSPQPPQLSEDDRDQLKKFLESSDKPFSVNTTNRKRKRGSTSKEMRMETDLFEDRLSVQYEIKPANNWESLRKYRKFTGNDRKVQSASDG